MSKQAQFYVIENTQPQGELSATEKLACDLSAQLWRAGKRILVACETEEQALRLDEALWQRDVDEFVPHNLSGEVTNFATPIEISWVGKRNAQRRDVLISLQHNVPDFAQSFNHIIDFVPKNETEKAQARERYKQYRQLGWQLSTEQV
ncbi:DNA polymerase III subunit chi [uncultured Actinobacillus sp.]|uniref:DNA polymerase III subunit chi n=1 Tax=uncultured Actinobacillus sp. TaxID=417616 RepID=UPI0025E2A982|nr:DNA polymerase III subunit chi [uncultured Actinobacillus sp.]